MWLAKLSISPRSCDEIRMVVSLGAFEQPFDQIFAHQRIQAAERFVQTSRRGR